MIGTIIIGYEQPSYAILAADRRVVANPLDPFSPVLYVDKICIHNTLPLAVAISGFGTLETGEFPSLEGEAPVKELIESRLFPRIRSEADLTRSTIVGHVKDVLLPMSINNRKHTKIQMPDYPRHDTTLWIALANGGRAELFAPILEDDIGYERLEKNEIVVKPPYTIENFYMNNYKQLIVETLPKIRHDVTETANFIKKLILYGIAEEARVDTNRDAIHEPQLDCYIISKGPPVLANDL